MDLEAFYEANEARRTSEEVEFGDSWTTADGHAFQLSWIAATGELYLMADDPNSPSVDIFGDIVPTPEATSELTVTVLGTVATLEELHGILDGWADALDAPGSLSWLTARLAARGVTPQK